jgi:hypothetical protein
MMAAICKNFHSTTNNIQTRVTKMFSDALKSDRAPLVSYYGAIAGLQVKRIYNSQKPVKPQSMRLKSFLLTGIAANNPLLSAS